MIFPVPGHCLLVTFITYHEYSCRPSACVNMAQAYDSFEHMAKISFYYANKLMYFNTPLHPNFI